MHMIFGYLTPTEIASMRLMSSNIAAIGLKHIARTVTVTLQEDSFDRLLDIAQHPIASKSVRNLYYEHGSLSHFGREEWEVNIRTPKLMAIEDEHVWKPYPGNDKSKRVWRAFHRDRNALKAYYTYGKKRLDQAFSTYQRHCAEEDRARQSEFFHDKLFSALHCFPNLETIYMLSGSIRYYSAETARILKGAYYYQRANHVNNVAVTFSVLAAIDRVHDSQIMNGEATNVDNEPAPIARTQTLSIASDNDLARNDQAKFGPGDGTSTRYCQELTTPGRRQRALQIKHFVLEDFDWTLLLEGDHVFSIIKGSLSNLTKLEIHLLVNSHRKSSKMNDLLHQFVKSAPGLEELNISLNHDPNPLSMILPDIVGSFHWISLKTVHFSELVIDADSLQEFCSRHSSTLSKFFLGDVYMGRHAHVAVKDALYSMFTKIRETTKFEESRVYGCLETSHDVFYMNDRTDGRRASGTLIGRYLMGEGGRSSLKDFVRDERRRIPRQDKSSSFNDTQTE